MILWKYLSFLAILWYEIESATDETYNQVNKQRFELSKHFHGSLSNDNELLDNWFECIFPDVTKVSDVASYSSLDDFIPVEYQNLQPNSHQIISYQGKINSTVPLETSQALISLQNLLVNYSKLSLVFNNSYVNFLRDNRNFQPVPIAKVYLLSEPQIPQHLDSLTRLEMVDELTWLLAILRRFSLWYGLISKEFQSELFNNPLLKLVPAIIKSQLKNGDLPECYQLILTLTYTLHDFLMDKYLKGLGINPNTNNLEIQFQIDHIPVVDLNNNDNETQIQTSSIATKHAKTSDKPKELLDDTPPQPKSLPPNKNLLVPISYGGKSQERPVTSLKSHLYNLATQKRRTANNSLETNPQPSHGSVLPNDTEMILNQNGREKPNERIVQEQPTTELITKTNSTTVPKQIVKPSSVLKHPTRLLTDTDSTLGSSTTSSITAQVSTSNITIPYNPRSSYNNSSGSSSTTQANISNPAGTTQVGVSNSNITTSTDTQLSKLSGTTQVGVSNSNITTSTDTQLSKPSGTTQVGVSNSNITTSTDTQLSKPSGATQVGVSNSNITNTRKTDTQFSKPSGTTQAYVSSSSDPHSTESNSGSKQATVSTTNKSDKKVTSLKPTSEKVTTSNKNHELSDTKQSTTAKSESIPSGNTNSNQAISDYQNTESSSGSSLGGGLLKAGGGLLLGAGGGLLATGLGLGGGAAGGLGGGAAGGLGGGAAGGLGGGAAGNSVVDSVVSNTLKNTNPLRNNFNKFKNRTPRTKKPRDPDDPDFDFDKLDEDNQQQTNKTLQQQTSQPMQQQTIYPLQQPNYPQQSMQNFQYQQNMHNPQYQQNVQPFQRQFMQPLQQQFIQYPNQQQYNQGLPIVQPYYSNLPMDPILMGGSSYSQNSYNPNPTFSQNFNGYPQNYNYSPQRYNYPPQALSSHGPKFISAPSTHYNKEVPKNPLIAQLSKLYNKPYDVMKRNQPIIDYLTMAHSTLPPRTPRKQHHHTSIEPGQLALLKIPRLSSSENVVGLIHARIPDSSQMIIQHYNIREKLYLPITVNPSQIKRIIT